MTSTRCNCFQPCHDASCLAADILNFGSLNIDAVYRVPHFIRPGETLACTSFLRNAGGKGLNQSIALARAGLHVLHAGKIGVDGEILVDLLRKNGVDTDCVLVGDMPTGQAIIEVEQDTGANRILLSPGANFSLTESEIDELLARAASKMQTGQGRWLLLQNEINGMPHVMRRASALGFRIAFNPSPFTPEIREYPLETVSLFFVNEIEAAEMCGMAVDADVAAMAEKLAERFPHSDFVMTLGSRGAMFFGDSLPSPVSVSAEPVTAVDTTGAGDTFTGFFLAYYLTHPDDLDRAVRALSVANRAAAISVTAPGAAESIPTAEQVFPC